MLKLNTHERLKLDWYLNRDKNILIQKKYLIKQIQKKEIPELNGRLEYLRIEDLFELAIAVINDKLTIVLGEGRDFDDDTDAKFTTVREHGGQYDANVNKENKIGVVMAKKKINKDDKLVLEVYEKSINKRMKAGHDVSKMTTRVSEILSKYKK